MIKYLLVFRLAADRLIEYFATVTKKLLRILPVDQTAKGIVGCNVVPQDAEPGKFDPDTLVMEVRQVEATVIAYRSLLIFICCALRPPQLSQNINIVFSLIRLFPLPLCKELLSRIDAPGMRTAQKQSTAKQDDTDFQRLYRDETSKSLSAFRDPQDSTPAESETKRVEPESDLRAEGGIGFQLRPLLGPYLLKMIEFVEFFQNTLDEVDDTSGNVVRLDLHRQVFLKGNRLHPLRIQCT